MSIGLFDCIVELFYVLAEKSGGVVTEVQDELQSTSKQPLKAKTTKAERRALQEAQRAAKGATKGSFFCPPHTIAAVGQLACQTMHYFNVPCTD